MKPDVLDLAETDPWVTEETLVFLADGKHYRLVPEADRDRWRAWALAAREALQQAAGERHLLTTGHVGAWFRGCPEPECVAVADLIASFPADSEEQGDG